ncbi:RHS repeat-associated core domain-containing protein [Shewanella sp. S1-58-MNA-CIBAN-0166]|uniref:RHS repeat-associated core domain-containing protein n=1 Tax=Shewanella sp. S1-58-MNA-CIBAN-0166 TaxID=3140467 RepID=UPI00333424BA
MRYWLTHLLLIEGRVNGSAGLERAEHIQQPASSALSSDTARPNKNLNDVVVNNDRLMSMAGVDYRYDASGNQISQIGSGDKQQRSFNGLNQLVQINVNGKLTQYEYDALGRRSAKITELGRTDFIWDNHQLIGECTLGEYSWYIYQPDTFIPVALIKAGQIYYYHLDQLGTPICLTDENAKIVWHSQQDVFGQTIESVDFDGGDNEHVDVYDAAKQDKITNPIRFQGQYFDDESGLHYNRFRYYSPQQARFIHQDPIGLVGGINHCQYTPNPVNWVDPFGLLCKEGVEKLSKMIGDIVDPATKAKILQIAEDSSSVDARTANIKVTRPNGENRLEHEYSIESMDVDNGRITLTREVGDKVIETTMTIEQFVGGHIIDGKLVNEEWSSKTGTLTENELKLNKATKKAGSKRTVSSLPVHLKEHVDTRDEEMVERDKHKAKASPEETQRYNDQIPLINNESAKIGEKAADAAIEILYPGYARIHPTSLDSSTSVSGNFDMVYKNADGDVIIVEAKGGSSPLGKKKIGDEYYQQGTTKYAQTITKSMRLKDPDTTDWQAADALKEASLTGKKVQYLHIETPITKTASGSIVGEVNISEFDIDPSKIVGT